MPDRPWYCAEPQPPCTPDRPCTDSCGVPIGHFQMGVELNVPIQAVAK